MQKKSEEKMSLLDDDPCHCASSDLDFSFVPPTDTTIVKNYYEKVEPTASANSSTVEFALKAKHKDFISLKNSFIKVSAKIMKAGKVIPTAPAVGAAVPDESKVFPINYFGATMFKNVKVSIGGVRISDSNDLYPYKSFFEYLLSYDPEVAEKTGGLSLWYKDTKEFDEVNTVVGTAHNSGAAKRFDRTKYGKIFEMSTRVHDDLFCQNKLIPGEVGLTIEFDRADVEFCLMAKRGGEKYMVEIQDISLMVKRYRVTDEYYDTFMKERRMNYQIKYPMRKVEMKYVTFGPQKSILQAPHIVNNTPLPKRVIVALVHLDGFSGNNNHNPINFPHFKVREVELKVNDGGTPFYQYEVDYPNDQYNMAYLAMLKSGGDMFRNDPINISLEEFKNGAAIYCFDISKNGVDSETFELSENGSLSLTFKLEEELNHGVAAVIYLEFDEILLLDQNNMIKAKSSLS